MISNEGSVEPSSTKTTSHSRVESFRIGRSLTHSAGRFAASLNTGITIATDSRLGVAPLPITLGSFAGELNFILLELIFRHSDKWILVIKAGAALMRTRPCSSGDL